MPDTTPMMKQYAEIKKDYPDAILFFRLGDFYEMFGPDAELASKELEITLTGRGSEEKRVPMCGVPHHAADSYLAKLINKGYKVAICEQVEDPKSALGVVKREVIKVVTPGTAMESSMLDSTQNNYLMALALEEQAYGLAFIDITTGEFKLTVIHRLEDLFSEIQRISPAECLLAEDEIKTNGKLVDFLKANDILITPYRYKDIVDSEVARHKLLKYFKVNSLASYGIERDSVSICAASAILEYLKETQKTKLAQITGFSTYITSEYMFIDSITRRNLELVSNVRDRDKKGSLCWVLDKTKTPMGARLLKSWILQPLRSKEKIESRLEAVEELSKDAILRAELGKEFNNLHDIERLVGKIASSSANARDLIALKESLKIIPRLKGLLKTAKANLLRGLLQTPDLQEIVDLIEKSIVDDPPFTLREGGIIKNGYNPEFDQIREAANSGKKWIAELENAERLRTGIKSLKVGFTKVFGYYIEVSTSNLKYVPAEYIRKQTLVNCERFITAELKDKEALILGAQERSQEIEYELFKEIRDRITAFTEPLQIISGEVASLDVLLSFSLVSLENHYVQPEIVDNLIEIVQGRHPVVEKMGLPCGFIPNDVILDNDQNRFFIITGPNMAGKSTYLRQVALIVLMAQIGSFVPAKTVRVCLVDRIFTRIGAMDDLSSGQSTFMVEMTEVSNILNNASCRSLVILDEIGRGTSTFDGMSIAAGVAEYIYNKLKSKTLFATHYHELTQLALKHSGIKNYNAAVLEEGEKIIFLYKILAGAADKSYGIHVARLAGLPAEVVKRAEELYSTLEMVENDLKVKKPAKDGRKKNVSAPEHQLGLF